MSGEPKQIVKAFDSDRTYHFVKAQLIELFTSSRSISRGDAYSNFFTATREVGETLRCFGIRLSTLAGKIDATIEGKDVLIRSKFISSLRPDVANQLKINLIPLDTVSIEKLVKMAAALEDLNINNSGSALQVSADESEVDIIRQVRQKGPTNPNPNANSGLKCYACGDIGHFRRDCVNQRREDVECYKCGRQGHFARNCERVITNKKQYGDSPVCVFCGGKHLMSKCNEFRRVCMSCSFCGDTSHRSVECSMNPAKNHHNQGN